MKRREFCKTLASVASLSAAPGLIQADQPAKVTSAGSSGAAPPAEHASPKKLLFFDLWKLDAWDNVELAQGLPEFVDEATYVDDSIPGKGAGKPSVYYDGQAGVWRMLYNIGWSPIRLMAAVSDDGLHWRPDPHPEIAVPEEAAGGKQAEHHVFTLPDAAAGGLYVDPIATDGFLYKFYAQQGGRSVYQRALADASHPWHKIARTDGDKRYFHQELMLVSEDGLRWQPRWDYCWSQADWHPEPPYFGFYNPSLQKHVMIVRPGWGDRRVGIQSTANFRDWSEPELLLQMDPLDDAPVGFYTMPVFAYGPLFVGLLWVFHNSSSQRVGSFNQFFGSMDAQLTYSYDGVHFIRGLRQAFLARTPCPEYGCAQLRPYSLALHEHEIRIYSGASRAPHGRERTLSKSGVASQAITVHRLREDGFSFLWSRGDWARLQTKPMAFWSPEVTLNAQATYGEVRYQVTDERSQAVEGFTFDDCVPLRGENRFDWPLQWRDADASDLIGKVIRLEIEFQNAELYSLSAAWHFLDAQDQWMLKDGLPIDTSRFDF